MTNNESKQFISTTELADILGISRVAVYQKILRGEIKATQVGRSYVIDKKDVPVLLGKELNEQTKKTIEAAVKKTVKEYGLTLELLGQE